MMYHKSNTTKVIEVSSNLRTVALPLQRCNVLICSQEYWHMIEFTAAYKSAKVRYAMQNNTLSEDYHSSQLVYKHGKVHVQCRYRTPFGTVFLLRCNF